MFSSALPFEGSTCCESPRCSRVQARAGCVRPCLHRLRLGGAGGLKCEVFYELDLAAAMTGHFKELINIFLKESLAGLLRLAVTARVANQGRHTLNEAKPNSHVCLLCARRDKELLQILRAVWAQGDVWVLKELIGVVLWFSSEQLGAVILGQIRAVCCESGSIWVCWCGKTLRGVKLEEKPHGFIKGRHKQRLGEGHLVLCGEKPLVQAPK